MGATEPHVRPPENHQERRPNPHREDTSLDPLTMVGSGQFTQSSDRVHDNDTAPSSEVRSPISVDAQAANDRLARTMANQPLEALVGDNDGSIGLIGTLMEARRSDPARFVPEYDDLMDRYRDVLGPERRQEYDALRSHTDAALASPPGVSSPAPDEGKEIAPVLAPEPAPAAETDHITVGDSKSPLQVVAWSHQHPVEDAAQWMSRTEYAHEDLSESLGRSLFERNRETFDALAGEYGLTVARDRGAIDLYLSGPDGTRYFTADTMGMARLSEEMTDDPAVRDVVVGIFNGTMTLDAVADRLQELEALPTGTAARRARRRDLPTLTSELAEERDRLRVAREALVALQQGESADQAADILISGFAPDPTADREAAIELALSILPVTGEIISARDAVTEFSEIRVRLEEGDLEGAVQAGLFGALYAMGAVPGVGTLGRLATRALGAVPVVGRWVPRAQLSYMSRRFPEEYPSYRMQDLEDLVPEKHRRAMQRLLNRSIGDAGEREIAQLMEKAGFEVFTDFAHRATRNADGYAMTGRIYDASTPQGVRNLFGLFWQPRRNGKGSVIEVKTGGSRVTKNQRERDEALLTDNPLSGVGPKPRNGLPREGTDTAFIVSDVQYLRVRLDQISEETLREGLSDSLASATRQGMITSEQADMILERIMSYRNQSTAENPITLLNAAAIVGMILMELGTEEENAGNGPT